MASLAREVCSRVAPKTYRLEARNRPVSHPGHVYRTTKAGDGAAQRGWYIHSMQVCIHPARVLVHAAGP